jgi:hypothetical protein
MPDYSGIQRQMRDTLATGANPEARQLGMNQMRSILTTPNAGMATNALEQTRQTYADALTAALRENDQQWKAAAGGADFANNSEYGASVQKIRADFARRMSADLAQQQQTIDTQEAANKMAAMQAALNLDDSQMQQALAIANLSVQQIQEQTGLSAAEAQQWQQLFSTIGQGMMQAGNPQTIQLKVAQ